MELVLHGGEEPFGRDGSDVVIDGDRVDVRDLLVEFALTQARRAPELTVTRCCPSPGFVAPKRVLPESV